MPNVIGDRPLRSKILKPTSILIWGIRVKIHFAIKVEILLGINFNLSYVMLG